MSQCLNYFQPALHSPSFGFMPDIMLHHILAQIPFTKTHWGHKTENSEYYFLEYSFRINLKAHFYRKQTLLGCNQRQLCEMCGCLVRKVPTEINNKIYAMKSAETEWAMTRNKTYASRENPFWQSREEEFAIEFVPYGDAADSSWSTAGTCSGTRSLFCAILFIIRRHHENKSYWP